MGIEHDSAVWFSKSFGLFYLMALSLAVVVYAYWPSNRKRFDHAAQSILRESPRTRACRSRASTPALLKGLLFGPSGRAMSPAHTRRGGKLYRYYVCQAALKGEISDAAIRRVSAAAIEAAGLAVQTVNKVTEGRPHIVDMIKNGDIALVINTVEERRNAIADSRAIRTSALLARVTTFTTIAGAEAAVEGMKFLSSLDVISVQDMHAQLA